MPVKTRATLHEFTIVLAHVEELTPDLADALYEIIDDGTAGSCNGQVFIDFHRKAPTFSDAVQSAIEDVHKAAHEVGPRANRGVPVGRADQRRIAMMVRSRSFF